MKNYEQQGKHDQNNLKDLNEKIRLLNENLNQKQIELNRISAQESAEKKQAYEKSSDLIKELTEAKEMCMKL